MPTIPSHPDHHAGEGHKPEPDEHAIRERAYAIWVRKASRRGARSTIGCAPGVTSGLISI